jgi:hypothetical protein
MRLLHRRPLVTNICTAGVVTGTGDLIAQIIEEVTHLKLSHIHQCTDDDHDDDDDKQMDDTDRYDYTHTSTTPSAAIHQHHHMNIELRHHHPSASAAASGNDTSKSGSSSSKQMIPFDIDTQRLLSMCSWGFVSAPVTFYWFRWLDSRYTSRVLFPNVLFKVFCNQLTYGPMMNLCFFYWMIAGKTGISTVQQRDTAWHAYRIRLEDDFLHVTMKSIGYWMIFHSINFKLLPPHTRVLFQYSAGMIWNTYLSIVGHDDGIRDQDDTKQRDTV